MKRSLGGKIICNKYNVLDGYRESQDVSGVSAIIVRQNPIVFTAASGVTDLETGWPMNDSGVSVRNRTALPTRGFSVRKGRFQTLSNQYGD